MKKKGFAITLIAFVIIMAMISHTVAIAQDDTVSSKTMTQQKTQAGDTVRTQSQERLNEKDLAENSQSIRARGEDGQQQKASGECSQDQTRSQTRDRLRTGSRGLNSSGGSASKSRSGSGRGRSSH
ncbi:MAG: hypothetical protein ACMUIP_08765 [bacterium]